MKCRKTIKKWKNGKLKILTRISLVNLVEENANRTVIISFTDVDGSSVKAIIKNGSAAREKIQPLLKGKRLEESMPKYPQYFLYDKEPFVGMWLSSSDCSADKSDVWMTTIYEMRNPRVLSNSPLC